MTTIEPTTTDEATARIERAANELITAIGLHAYASDTAARPYRDPQPDASLALLLAKTAHTALYAAANTHPDSDTSALAQQIGDIAYQLSITIGRLQHEANS